MSLGFNIPKLTAPYVEHNKVYATLSGPKKVSAKN